LKKLPFNPHVLRAQSNSFHFMAHTMLAYLQSTEFEAPPWRWRQYVPPRRW